MTRLDDETLLAYADGELDPRRAAEVEVRLRDDPEARQRLERLRESARLARDAFRDTLEAPVPERLLKALDQDSAPAMAKVLPFKTRSRPPRSLPLKAAAAVLVAALGLGLLWIGTPAPRPPLAGTDALLQKALETRPGGRSLADGGREITPLLTVRSGDGGYCRQFQEQRGGEGYLGVACRNRDGVWLIRVLLARALLAQPADSYGPASGPAPAAPAALLDALTEGQALTPAQEAGLLERGWQ